ncbi:hypothetical protein AVEN_158135-1 [Araneus ventricosus]|uniref:Uncharacterized protein n=1 Tax=Araneus ventricosus TaxID=182803 RepID=A0A4Y2Q3U5_ARAVE|nr:hypothetical protein AVEN_158135-1 [Araneus ventricosus]
MDGDGLLPQPQFRYRRMVSLIPDSVVNVSLVLIIYIHGSNVPKLVQFDRLESEAAGQVFFSFSSPSSSLRRLSEYSYISVFVDFGYRRFFTLQILS